MKIDVSEHARRIAELEKANKKSKAALASGGKMSDWIRECLEDIIAMTEGRISALAYELAHYA